MRGGRGCAAAIALVCAAIGCGEGGTAPMAGPAADIRFSIERLPPLAPGGDQRYEAWAVDGTGGIHLLGPVEPDADGRWEGVLPSRTAEPAAVLISIERSGERGPGPSLLMVLGGPVRDRQARLDVAGYLTPNLPLEEDPGAHVLGTHWESGPPGLPARDDAGIWLHDPAGDTADASLYLVFTPLTEGWTYGGWVVRDYGTPDEVWVSYGTFRPDPFRRASARDYSGLGPFSGKSDYRRALPLAVTYPGDDWLANVLGVPVPGGLPLPFDLNGCLDPADECRSRGEEPGPSRWTHVITVEPYDDRYEDPWLARPTPFRIYRNPIGEAGPDTPRALELLKNELPRGGAVVEPR